MLLLVQKQHFNCTNQDDSGYMIEEGIGFNHIQLKEMSQDRERWAEKILKWSSAVANLIEEHIEGEKVAWLALCAGVISSCLSAPGNNSERRYSE